VSEHVHGDLVSVGESSSGAVVRGGHGREIRRSKGSSGMRKDRGDELSRWRRAVNWVAFYRPLGRLAVYGRRCHLTIEATQVCRMCGRYYEAVQHDSTVGFYLVLSVPLLRPPTDCRQLVFQ
jgi:hypothetical protein